jgi:hypothetical protein
MRQIEEGWAKENDKRPCFLQTRKYILSTSKEKIKYVFVFVTLKVESVNESTTKFRWDLSLDLEETALIRE